MAKFKCSRQSVFKTPPARLKGRRKPATSRSSWKFCCGTCLLSLFVVLITGGIVLVQALNAPPGDDGPFSPESLASFQVRILNRDGVAYCVGSIVSPSAVLTSAQCVYGLTAKTGQTMVVAGLVGSWMPQMKLVRTIIYHKDFDPVLLRNDIALLLLMEELQLSSAVRMVPRATPAEVIPEGARVLNADWATNPRSFGAKFENASTCLPFRINFNTSEHLCSRVKTFHSFGVTPGEPLFCPSSFNPAQPILCGISSSGRSLNRKAVPETLSVHTSVGAYNLWIGDHIHLYGHSSPQRETVLRGAALSEQGHYREALDLLTRLLSKYESSLGSKHPEILSAKHIISLIYFKLEKLPQSFQLIQEVLSARSELLGPTHMDTVLSQHELAVHYAGRNDYSSALSIYRYVLRLQVETQERENEAIIRTNHNMAQMLYYLGQHNETLRILSYLQEVELRKLGPLHPQTLGTKFFIANIHKDLEDFAGALPILQELARDFQKTLGAHHDLTLHAKQSLALVHFRHGSISDCLQLLPEVLEGFTQLYGPNADHTLAVVSLMKLISANFIFAADLDENE